MRIGITLDDDGMVSPVADGEPGGSGKLRPAVGKIGILLFDGFSFLMAGVISEVFQFANEVHAAQSNGSALYEVRFLSIDGGQIWSSSPLSVWTHACDTFRAGPLDVLFVGDGRGARSAAADPRLLRWLSDVLPCCGVVEALVEGRDVLEAARSFGLRGAGGCPAPVHASPETSGWTTPTTTALARVKRDLGVEVAHQIANRLSSAGACALNSVFAEVTAASSVQKVRAAVQWFEQNCERPLQVADVARMAAMSERNFLRYFKRETGLTPLRFLLRARLERASTFLATTDLPLDSVAKRCGWKGGDKMIRVFVKRFACTPAEYRSREQALIALE